MATRFNLVDTKLALNFNVKNTLTLSALATNSIFTIDATVTQKVLHNLAQMSKVAETFNLDILDNDTEFNISKRWDGSLEIYVCATGEYLYCGYQENERFKPVFTIPYTLGNLVTRFFVEIVSI